MALCLSQTVPTAPAMPTASTPAPVRWVGAITASILMSRGETDLNGLTISGEAAHTGVERGYKAEGLYMYNSIAIPGRSDRFVAQDRRGLAFTFNQKLDGPVSFLDRASVDSDQQRGLVHRYMNMLGITIQTPKKERFQLALTPGIAVVNERKVAFPADAGTHATPAIFQTARYQLNKAWSVSQYILYRTRVSNSHDYQLDGYAGLTGMVFTQRIGMQLAYRYTYEGLVGPGFKRTNSQFTVGVSVKI